MGDSTQRKEHIKDASARRGRFRRRALPSRRYPALSVRAALQRGKFAEIASPYGVSPATVYQRLVPFDLVQARGVTRLHLSWAERAFDRSSGGPNKGRALEASAREFQPILQRMSLGLTRKNASHHSGPVR